MATPRVTEITDDQDADDELFKRRDSNAMLYETLIETVKEITQNDIISMHEHNSLQPELKRAETEIQREKDSSSSEDSEGDVISYENFDGHKSAVPHHT